MVSSQLYTLTTKVTKLDLYDNQIGDEGEA
jgi:hypothetical protein